MCFDHFNLLLQSRLVRRKNPRVPNRPLPNHQRIKISFLTDFFGLLITRDPSIRDDSARNLAFDLLNKRKIRLSAIKLLERPPMDSNQITKRSNLTQKLELFRLIFFVQACSWFHRKSQIFSAFYDFRKGFDDSYGFRAMLEHIRSSATFHHRIARASGIQLNPRKIISILFYKNFSSFNEGFRISSVDLSNGLGKCEVFIMDCFVRFAPSQWRSLSNITNTH